MHVHIKGQIFNMDRFDSCVPLAAKGDYPHRIAFIRDNEEWEYASFESKDDLDKEWKRIVRMVDSWYS